jgi:twitching motility protein PilT
MTFESLVAAAAAHSASDIHLRAGRVPLVRLHGTLQPLTTIGIDAETAARPMTAAVIDALATKLLTPGQQEKLQRELEVDAAWQVPGVGRCRVSVFRQRGTTAVALRLIPATVPPLETLGVPPAVAALAEETRGLVLVTGATGSGKSTTLAALVDKINRARAAHILTIEDPIEFIHNDAKAVISQREVGLDTPSYASGLKSALRQDPNVILIGEMRDIETIETALIAAETGHLVMSTLHTLDAPETINRIIAVFPPHHQDQIRIQLARVLRASVSQRLLARADGQGRVLATEVLVSTPYVRDLVADPQKTSLLAGAIAAGGSEYGMQTFDQAIFALCSQQLVSVEEAMRWVTNIDEFKMRLRGFTPGGGTGAPATTPDILRLGQ